MLGLLLGGGFGFYDECEDWCVFGFYILVDELEECESGFFGEREIDDD